MPTQTTNLKICDRAGFTLDGVDHFGVVLETTDFGVTIDAETHDKPVPVPWVDVLPDVPVEADAVVQEPALDAVDSPIPVEVEAPLIEETVAEVQVEVQAEVMEVADVEEAQTAPQLDSVEGQFQRRAEIDAILIQSGFDPGIDYIRANYGDHWCKREVAAPVVLDSVVSEPIAAPDFSPIVSGIGELIAGMSNAHAGQISGLTAAIALLAEKSTVSQEINQALMAALCEARKPMDINLKLEMPEQKAVSKTIRRNPDGSMTMVEG